MTATHELCHFIISWQLMQLADQLNFKSAYRASFLGENLHFLTTGIKKIT